MTIFSKIITGEIPSDKLYEDKDFIVIRDINPQEKTHLLIIPKKEIISINNIDISDREILASMFFIAKKISKSLGIEKSYRLIVNAGDLQEIPHIHMHLLSKKETKFNF